MAKKMMKKEKVKVKAKTGKVNHQHSNHPFNAFPKHVASDPRNPGTAKCPSGS